MLLKSDVLKAIENCAVLNANATAKWRLIEAVLRAMDAHGVYVHETIFYGMLFALCGEDLKRTVEKVS